MSQKLLISRITLFLAVLFALSKQGFAQVSIAGPSCVVAGTTSFYTFSGSYTSATTMTWCVSNGTIQQAYGTNITGTGSCRYGNIYQIAVLWSSGGTGSVTLQSSNGDASPLSINIVNALIPGTITTNVSQSIAYNSPPANITCSVATYGACSPAYAYQWQRSTDGGSTFTDISGETGQNISFTPQQTLITTTNYRRKVTETSTNTAAYSNAATVTVGAPFSATTIAPAVQNVFAGATVAALSGPAATGGSCGGSYTYVWQKSTNGGNTFTDIGAPNSTSYTPPVLSATTYYRRKDVCGSDQAFSNAVVVNVFQHLGGGSLSVAANTITYGTDPGLITGNTATGGMCDPNYSYQWQSSTDNGVTFNDLPGVTSYNYSPGVLTATTSYRRKAICNPETALSNTIIITVNPKIFPGVILVDSWSIAANTNAGTIIANAATGGACSNNFVYQWQKSVDGTENSFTDIAGATGQNYAAGNLAVTTYFRRKVTCGIDVLYTNSCVISVGTTTPVYNYIQARVITKLGVTDETSAAQLTNPIDVRQTTQYFDGLGRLIQTVNKQASPATYDMVVPNAYNEFGREVVKFLPYAATATNGSYKTMAMSDQAAFYNPAGSQGTQLSKGIARITTPYSVTGFESSPLNVVLEQGAPGDTWQLPGAGDAGSTGHTSRMVYTTNDQTSTFVSATLSNNPGSKIVALYTATVQADLSRTLGRTSNATYDPGQLSVTISRDENWQPADGCIGTIEEYKDNNGHVVLKRTYNLKGNAVEMLSTYYVYDNLGNLCFVLPPGAGADAASSFSPTTLNNLCYQYQYDGRNRLVQKRVPGKDWEYIVYNKLDQPVATQDANQRAQSLWEFTKYDALGRTVLTGTWNSAGVDRPTLQTTLNGLTINLWEAPAATGNGYTNVAWPKTAVAATLTVNYYDGYDNIPGLPAAYTVTSGVSKMTKGLPTVKKTAVLNNPADQLWDVMYYDDLSRNILSYAQHYLGGTSSLNTANYDMVTNTYDFTNVVTTSTRKHYTTAGGITPVLTIANTYTYDHMGRKKETTESINGAASTLLSHLDYNEIGQLYQKGLHGINGGQAGVADITLGTADAVSSGQSKTVTATHSILLQAGFTAASGSTFKASISGSLQTVTYTYNERGWLTQSTAPLFAMQLKYNDGSTPQYNGNIANQLWGTPGTLNKNYTYSYDRLNRLTSGISGDGNNETGIVYDQMGNITALQRTSAGTTIDNLAYNYTIGGNPTYQLNTITDASGSNSGMANGVTTYNSYDGNGNSTYDGRNATAVTYNLLNLPQTIPGKSIVYTYDASGQKLRRVIGTTATDYISGIQYTNGVIDFIQTEEGRALQNGATYNYEYNLSDNLGNTRITFDTGTGVARLQQQDDYYPFGMDISRGTVPSPQNKYLYNKKELQDGLGQYDYGARFYDPVVARWSVVDPMAEQDRRTTPYSYTFDDPIRHTDPDGMFGEEANDDNGEEGSGDCCGLSTPAKVTGGAIIGGGAALAGSIAVGGLATGPGEIVAVPVAAVVFVGAVVGGTAVAIWNHFTNNSNSTNPDLLNGGTRLPPEQIKSPPTKPGNPPIGLDGHPIELHHREQHNPNTPLDETSRTDHRLGENYKKNHPNTGQSRSNVKRPGFNSHRKKHWKQEHDSGRFTPPAPTTPTPTTPPAEPLSSPSTAG